MANSRTHTKVNFVVILASLLALLIISDLKAEFLLLSALFAVAGTVFLSPDLDLTNSHPARYWGPFSLLWKGYTKLFRHRGWSHVPVVGTLTRLLYLSFVLGGVALVVDALVYIHSYGTGIGWAQHFTRDTDAFLQFLIDKRLGFVAALVGLFYADVLHISTDCFSSLLKAFRS